MPPEVVFDCHALWGSLARGVDYRSKFLSRELNVSRERIAAISAHHLGVGALFTKVFSRYDLLISWQPNKNGTVQRLSNLLATGVPVIALRSPAYEGAFGNYDGVLLATNHSELSFWSHALAKSPELRRRVSDAGVAAAAQFSRSKVSRRYRAMLAELVSKRARITRADWYQPARFL